MPVTTTARGLITGTLRLLGVLAQGEDATASEMVEAFARLNELVDAWETQRLTMRVVERRVFDLTADVGTYLMGPDVVAPDFVMPRPTVIDAVSLLLTNTTPNTEVPLSEHTERSWQGIAQKALTNSMPTGYAFMATMPASTLDEVKSLPGVEVAEGSVTSDGTMLDKEGEPIVSNGPPTLLTSFEDERPAVLARLEKLTASQTSVLMPIEAIALATSKVRENGSPFSAIVVVSAHAIDATKPSSIASRVSLHLRMAAARRRRKVTFNARSTSRSGNKARPGSCARRPASRGSTGLRTATRTRATGFLKHTQISVRASQRRT